MIDMSVAEGIFSTTSHIVKRECNRINALHPTPPIITIRAVFEYTNL